MYYDDQDGCEETFAEHGSYKADCKGVADETWSRTLSHKFETEPEKYLEEKLLNALMEQLLVRVCSLKLGFLYICNQSGRGGGGDAAGSAAAQ